MKKVRQLINLASIGTLTIGLLPALSQAGTITLGDGSQYEVKLQSHVGNTWTYFVKELSGKSLSHWNVGIKACMDKGAVVSSSPTGDVEDGSTDFEGMKWDVSEGFTEGVFSITLDADYPETTILAQAKAGKRGNERTGEVMGPDCQAEANESESESSNNNNEGFNAPAFFAPDSCDFIYGVHDDGLNNSQLLGILDFEIDVLGGICEGCDIEAADISLEEKLYVASSDETGKPGVLYKADMMTGELTEIGSTGFAEIDGISFNPKDGTLWVVAQDVGLGTINIETGKGTLVHPMEGEFEDLTWNNDGTILYMALNSHKAYDDLLLSITDAAAYDPDLGNDAKGDHFLIAFDVTTTPVTVTEICREVLGDKEVEALEILPDGKLMLGYHTSKDQPMLTVVDPTTCKVIKDASPTYDITDDMPFGDIEALAACIQPAPGIADPEFCPIQDTDWMYAKDSFTDGTGHNSLEIYGVAVKQEGETIIVAINANMGTAGETDWSALPKRVRNKILDGHVGFSDFVLDFGDGVKYAVHFAVGNDSSVTTLGLYQDISFKDVAKENAGYRNLSSYQKYAKNPSLGDISFSGGYFDVNSENSVPMSIKSGTRVDGDNFTPLTEAELAGMGLDFVSGFGVSNASELGSDTFGFSFTKTDDMVGDFTSYFFTECRNDGVGIIGELPGC